MARMISVVIAGGLLLVAATCMLSARQQSLFFETGATPPAQTAEAAPIPAV